MGRKRHLVGIAVSVVLLAVAGCGQDNAHNEPVRQSAIPEGDRCHPVELTVVSTVVSTVPDDQSGEHIKAEIRMTNTSNRSCRLEGYPGLRLRDKNSRSSDVEVHRTGAVTGPLDLPPGSPLVSTLEYDTASSRDSAPCSQAIGLLVTLPDEIGEFTAPINTYGPLMCAGHPIEMGPLAAAVYGLDGSIWTGQETPCRIADLTIVTGRDSNPGMSKLGFGVKVTNHTDRACVIAGYGPTLQLVDREHNLQYPEVPKQSTSPIDVRSIVIPAGSTGVMHGAYVDGPICGPEGEKPVPTAFLRAGVPGDSATIDIPFSATVYCHGGLSVGMLMAD
ncbi:DUF4232 domain-containing protein [Nocardia sp. NPDC059240]|uniref:DUF4232 domain-containing protein n=1 Tax=Nocardia sp. NPDC059240 TaxID=3346786 RepID=UPI00367D6CE3